MNGRKRTHLRNDKLHCGKALVPASVVSTQQNKTKQNREGEGEGEKEEEKEEGDERQKREKRERKERVEWFAHLGRESSEISPYRAKTFVRSFSFAA